MTSNIWGIMTNISMCGIDPEVRYRQTPMGQFFTGTFKGKSISIITVYEVTAIIHDSVYCKIVKEIEVRL